LQENIDTTTSGGKLIFHIFASLAEFERDIIRERTNAGLTAALARGRKGGRPKGVDEKKRQAALSLKKDLYRSVKDICEIVGISRNTYYKYTRSEDKPKMKDRELRIKSPQNPNQK
jgi:DNA invertase Pin-like site-specific DNA recombinase